MDRADRPRLNPWIILLIPLLVFAITRADAEEPEPERPRVQHFHRHSGLPEEQVWVVRSLELLTGAYFFVLGATVGSFLNVVVGRMPAGMGLVSPRSHCPRCGTPIRASDNIPIIGWLRLRGRCRDCGISIPVRYLFMEIGVGGLFLLLAMVELFSGGANLPVRAPNAYAGVVWTVWQPKWDLIEIYLYHISLLSILVVATMIRLGGHALPSRLMAWSIGIGLLPPLLLPGLRPVPFQWPLSDWANSFPLPRGPIDGIAGLIAGAFFGILLALAERSLSPGEASAPDQADGAANTWWTAPRREMVFATELVGAFLGWQAVVLVALTAAVARLGASVLSRVASRAIAPNLLPFSLATLATLLFWRQLTFMPWLPGPSSGPVCFFVCAALVSVLSLLARRIEPATPLAQPTSEPAEMQAAPEP